MVILAGAGPELVAGAGPELLAGAGPELLAGPELAPRTSAVPIAISSEPGDANSKEPTSESAGIVAYAGTIASASDWTLGAGNAAMTSEPSDCCWLTISRAAAAAVAPALMAASAAANEGTNAPGVHASPMSSTMRGGVPGAP